MVPIQSEQKGKRRKIVLNRHDRLNAFNDDKHEVSERTLHEAVIDVRYHAVCDVLVLHKSNLW